MRTAMRLSMVLMMAVAAVTLNGCMMLGGGLGAGVGGGGGQLLGGGALTPIGGLGRGGVTSPGRIAPGAPDDRVPTGGITGADAGGGIVTAGTGGVSDGATGTGGLVDPFSGPLDSGCST